MAEIWRLTLIQLQSLAGNQQDRRGSVLSRRLKKGLTLKRKGVDETHGNEKRLSRKKIQSAIESVACVFCACRDLLRCTEVGPSSGNDRGDCSIQRGYQQAIEVIGKVGCLTDRFQWSWLADFVAFSEP